MPSKPWADDPTQRKPDTALAKRVLDWTPRVALDDGLTQAIAYFRDSGGGAACSSLTSACSDWTTLPPASSATWTKSRRSPAPQWASFKFIKGDIRKLDDCRRDDEEDYLRARWQVQT